jgi:hypothetical protein
VIIGAAHLPWVPARPEMLWDAWAFAAVEAELALDAWSKAAHDLKDATFAAYRNALDREEEAAAALAARVAPKVGRRLQTRWNLTRAAA